MSYDQAAGNPDAIPGPLGLGKVFLKGLHVFAQDERRIGDDIAQTILDFVEELRLLGLEIKKWDFQKSILCQR